MIGKMIENWRKNREERNQRRRANRLRSRPWIESLEERAVPTVSPTDTFIWLPGQVGGPGNSNWSASHFNTNTNQFVTNWWDLTTNTGTGTLTGWTVPGASSTVLFSGTAGGHSSSSDANCSTDAVITAKALTIDIGYTHTLSIVANDALTVSGASVFKGGTGAAVNLAANYYSKGGMTWSSGLVSGSAWLRFDGGSPNWIGGTKIGGVVTLDSSTPELGTGTNVYINTSSATTYIGFYASGANFQLDSGSQFDIGKGTVVLCQDQGHDSAGNNGTSGGITGALALVEVSAGGVLKRELFSRSNGDAPNATAVEIASPVQTDAFAGVTNGQLVIGDSLGLELQNGLKNQGTLTFTGGSVLTVDGGFVQSGNPAITNMAYGSYNSKYNTELAVNKAYFYAGVIDLDLASQGKYGTFSVVAAGAGNGDVQIGDSVGGTTCSLDLYYHDSTNNSVFSVAGALTFSAASGSENSINLTWQGASGHNATGWIPIVYASTNANPGVNEAAQFFGYPYVPMATWYDSGANHFLKVTW